MAKSENLLQILELLSLEVQHNAQVAYNLEEPFDHFIVKNKAEEIFRGELLFFFREYTSLVSRLPTRTIDLINSHILSLQIHNQQLNLKILYYHQDKKLEERHQKTWQLPNLHLDELSIRQFVRDLLVEYLLSIETHLELIPEGMRTDISPDELVQKLKELQARRGRGAGNVTSILNALRRVRYLSEEGYLTPETVQFLLTKEAIDQLRAMRNIGETRALLVIEAVKEIIDQRRINNLGSE